MADTTGDTKPMTVPEIRKRKVEGETQVLKPRKKPGGAEAQLKELTRLWNTKLTAGQQAQLYRLAVELSNSP